MKPPILILSLVAAFAAGMFISWLRRDAPDEFEPFNVGPMIVALDPAPDGTVYGLGTDGVFIFFNPACRFCDSSTTFWRELAAACEVKGVRIIALALTYDRATVIPYAHAHGLFFPVYVAPDENEYRQLYKITGTPTIYRFHKGKAVAQLVGAPVGDYNILIHQLIGDAP